MTNGVAGDQDVQALMLAEMKQQTEAINDIRSAAMWWLALSILGVLIAVAVVVQHS